MIPSFVRYSDQRSNTTGCYVVLLFIGVWRYHSRWAEVRKPGHAAACHFLIAGSLFFYFLQYRVHSKYDCILCFLISSIVRFIGGATE